MSAPPPFSPTIMLLTLGRTWDAEYAEALKPLGLTTRKYGLLGHIRAVPDISFSELARRSRITVQSVHTAVAGFVAAGLVGDGTAQAGSASTLRITAAGDDLLNRAAAEVARLDADFADRYPELTAAFRAEMARAWEAAR